MELSRTKKKILSAAVILAMLMLLLSESFIVSNAVTSASSFNLEAKATVKTEGGAILRKKASLLGKKIAILRKDAPLVIVKTVFTKKNKSSAKYRWYYVRSAAGKGYIRSDYVKILKYSTATGTALAKLNIRAGAGGKMKLKTKVKKGKQFTIVMKAKAKSSSYEWYKIKLDNKYYYVCNMSNIELSDNIPAEDLTVGNPAADIIQSAAAKKVVNGACKWAIQIANDNRFHYGKKPASQHNGCYFCGTQMLKGGRSKKGVLDYEFSYCCNPFVHAAFAHGGKEATMLKVCQKGSSYWVTTYPKSSLFANLGVPDTSLLKKGDVLCWKNHVMLYIGDGKIAEATGGDDNVKNSTKWNNSIRVTNLTSSKYKKVIGAYRYIGEN